MQQKKIVRCAIYTRKSTEEGLDMDYNTLDAQREAGEKYVEAMKHEGWRIIPDLYDDGGFSGGNMDRPGLKKLIEDIKAGRIDTVVVYKVDRLTRSLADFAKLVEVFDAYGTSFVSVTQHFNTQDSMGRLTLNILLSFAQFEREVTGERIRDKFAASKKKGMWMGGPPPLGYDVVDRKLIINPVEAEQVKYIFETYVLLGGSVSLVLKKLNDEGYKTKSYTSRTGQRRGGHKYGTATVKTILRNRLYIAEVHHKGTYYPGQHRPIISMELFNKAQEVLAEKATVKSKRTYAAKSDALLKGIIVCGGCHGAMSPTYTKKKDKRYDYYVTNSYRQHSCGECPVSRIPAGEIDAIIKGQLKAIFASPKILVEVWRHAKKDNPAFQEYELHESLRRLGSFWDLLYPGEQKRITQLLISRVVVKSNGVDIEYRASGIEDVVHQLQLTINKQEQLREAS
ncbi:MAG: recombinase family protein [Pseudomonadota bacterium]|nr:recombinase family protein [Pseudomonadota bacterium]